ncbi:hypothetical protein [Halorhabdus tiamatea]|nr:hypothetical protein [Halorhabdus tiamatea]CCQ33427.1 hypothetical protein HTIA_1293 [Halorhabdus tiamatea SARL4B]
MAAESDDSELPKDLSPKEARRYLIRYLGKRDLEEHEEIYEELAHE